MNAMEKRLKELERMAFSSMRYGTEAYMETCDKEACVGIRYDSDGYRVGYYLRGHGPVVLGPYSTTAEAAWHAYSLYLTDKDEVDAMVSEIQTA